MTEYKRRYWILDKDRNPVEAPDRDAYWAYMATDDRVVAKTKVGKLTVSTVMLGEDVLVGSRPDDKPLLFETMVFGRPHGKILGVYYTWAEAEAGHALSVKQETAKLKRAEARAARKAKA